MPGFWKELHQRRVIKVAIAYLVMAWVVLQLADVIFPAMGLPDWTITLVLALLAVGFPVALVLAWVFDITPGGLKRTAAETPDTAETPATEPPAPAPDMSIAVLPFPDLSAERNQEHFCDGLTEELLNVLTGIPGLRVASRTSCFAFKGKDADLREVAERLRVAHVLEGSVRKAGNTLRITAQLIEVASDSHLWSENYDVELDDIFAIQDDIARRILGVLQLKLGPGARVDATTTDARAYELFLRGRGYALTRITQDHPRAISMFRQAVELDPGFARAWIELAEVAANNALYHGGGDEARALSEQAAARAMELAPERSGSYMAAGFVHLARKEYAEAEEDFLKALELNPDEFLVLHYLGRTAHFRGLIDKARAYFTRATEADPEDWESPLLAIQGYEEEGDDEGARRVAEIGLERARRYIEAYPDNPRAYYLGASAMKTLGDPGTGAEWANRALELSPGDAATRYNAACYFATTGDTERALDLLENSITSRSWIENDWELRSLRDHPRYQAVLDSLPE